MPSTDPSPLLQVRPVSTTPYRVTEDWAIAAPEAASTARAIRDFFIAITPRFDRGRSVCHQKRRPFEPRQPPFREAGAIAPENQHRGKENGPDRGQKHSFVLHYCNTNPFTSTY